MNIIRYSKAKFKVLHLIQGIPNINTGLIMSDCTEGSPVEKDFRV